MAFLAFQTADIFYCYAIHFAGLKIIMKFFIDAIEFIAGRIGVIEVHLGFTVTVDAPAHA